ncbi:MAG TPA: DinB family protein [Longimicrobium sp.]|nr:DinB family protein [Longimicrobium sp.]
MPSIAELLLTELEREAAGTRRALERVPEGRNGWKPHEKSMELGYLAGLVATIPAWIASMATEAELDLEKPGELQTKPYESRAELLAAFDQAMARAREALGGVTDEHLFTKWRLRVQRQVVLEEQRYFAIRESAINHLAHHRGQLTVYLRLNDAPVPALYGPSADEGGPAA